ncbi:HAD family hydrolase [Aquimarina aquimarini]|uniref:HAD family hydrolase n=1 Tax=Aquimarina aquimarini TaxID=1191734 RepID=UPI000D55B199|nr:HAD family phosphatase [Aquimarina aquimarini]
MIKTLVFDFGDVFINLDKPATEREFLKLGEISSVSEIQRLNKRYEVGAISTQELITSFQTLVPEASKNEIINAWNAILKDFPKHRFEFIKKIASEQQYKLILLSNTNELHIKWIAEHIPFFEEFKSCFDIFYLSHQIQMRKPNTEIFEFVLNQNKLNPTETLFIDDTKENTDAAASLGIHTWNNNPKTEDVTSLFTTKSDIL